MTNTLIEQAKAAAASAKLKNQAEASAGDFEREVPAAGPCFARFIAYIEVGKQKPRGEDKFNKGPRATAILEFQLLGKKHAKEIEVDGVKKIIYPIHREFITLSNSPKSWAYKLFNSMDYGRGNTHFALMLGEAFKINVVHVETGEGKDKKVFANIRDDSGWKVSAPVIEQTDEETGDVTTRPAKVPAEQGVEIRLLLWDSPTIEQWNSIFIDGTRTIKKNNKDVEVSKNWLQEQCTDATDFEGSEVQSVVLAAGGDLPKAPSTDPDDGLGDADEPDEVDVGPDADTGSPEEGDASGDEPDAPAADPNDPLAGLDLDDEA